MSISLAKSLNEIDPDSLKRIEYTDPAQNKKFFTKKELESIEKFYYEREAHPIGNPFQSCSGNLFLGFFFDGTRNNYALSEMAKDNTHSNVARLFDAYPGQTIAPALLMRQQVRWPDEAKYPNYFRIYVPGVGTPFEEIGDSGERGGALTSDGGKGAAFARWGERRLVWGLAQAINSVHRFFRKETLLKASDIDRLCKVLTLDGDGLRQNPIRVGRGGNVPANAKAHLQVELSKLHAAIRPHMPDPKTGKVAKTDPGVVNNIYVSTFGFSRGAAAARAFTNWFLTLCELDAALLGQSGPTLGGFPVTFDFLGLFDTVASVGLASSALITDGHGGWADAEVSLRVPSSVKCTHLVSAHEQRRSFPLDSISVSGLLNSGCKEIVFPGVHSDVGGGYAPKEQGRGLDAEGADMLSRIPLAVMYREARLAGAPLKLELAPPIRKKGFKVDNATIDAFNAYLTQCAIKQGNLREIMHEQMELAIRWRKQWAGRMGQLPSVRRAAQVDINDIVSADQEFVDEVKAFEAWRKQPFKTEVFCPNLFYCKELERSTFPGVDPSRGSEWSDIAAFWDKGPVKPEIANLFENFVHDSRAWFKLTGYEAAEVETKLKEWVRRHDTAQKIPPFPPVLGAAKQAYKLSGEQEAWVMEYKRTGKVPPMKTHGREMMELGAGYLRWRRVYAGGDTLRLTEWHEQSPRHRAQQVNQFANISTGELNQASAA